jgi:hypothetical protein
VLAPATADHKYFHACPLNRTKNDTRALCRCQQEFALPTRPKNAFI